MCRGSPGACVAPPAARPETPASTATHADPGGRAARTAGHAADPGGRAPRRLLRIELLRRPRAVVHQRLRGPRPLLRGPPRQGGVRQRVPARHARHLRARRLVVGRRGRGCDPGLVPCSGAPLLQGGGHRRRPVLPPPPGLPRGVAIGPGPITRVGAVPSPAQMSPGPRPDRLCPERAGSGPPRGGYVAVAPGVRRRRRRWAW